MSYGLIVRFVFYQPLPCIKTFYGICMNFKFGRLTNSRVNRINLNRVNRSNRTQALVADCICIVNGLGESFVIAKITLTGELHLPAKIWAN